LCLTKELLLLDIVFIISYAKYITDAELARGEVKGLNDSAEKNNLIGASLGRNTLTAKVY